MAFDLSTLRRDYGEPELEAYACRTNCALFDYSFIGRARLDGPGALDAVRQLTRRPLTGLLPGQIRYALRADSNGHLLSDLTVWRHGKTRYEVMSGRSDDISDLVVAAWPGCEAEDLSARTSIIAVQGPGSLHALAGLTDAGATAKLDYFTFMPIRICNVHCLVGRLGYTASLASKLCCHALRHRNSGTCWRGGRDPPALPRPTCCGSRRASCCLRMSSPSGDGAGGLPRALRRFVWCAKRAGDHPRLLSGEHSREARSVAARSTCPSPNRSGMITVTSACHSLQAGGTLGLGYALRSDLIAGVPLHDPTGAFADIRLASLPFFDPQKRRPRTPWTAPEHGQ
ncbi:MAG: hypothetical protein GEU91_14405 [Rhizobiales bacterium]|nr:hypothetical protein [Hyphomicrobiales bacterium]